MTLPAFTHHPSKTPRSQDVRQNILSNPGFGAYFTDHMAASEWTCERGWFDARICPYGPISLDPAAGVLHYAQEIFEGIKVYRHADGGLWTFRPEANARRFDRSAQRLALPQLSPGMFTQSLRELVTADAAWVPSGAETSLYCRPFMIASEPFLGVRAARAVSYYVIASPAGAYFATGLKPAAIWVSTTYARASKGGTGAAKCGGNYAASLLPQRLAQEHGCSQVLFLDAVHGKYIEELGGMNLFVVYRDHRIVTPALSGTILEGITRDSIITLARAQGYTVEEQQIPLDTLCAELQSGDVTELFACGTAAVITPIGCLKGENFSIGSTDVRVGEVTTALRQSLTDIQYGRAKDPYQWMVRLV